MKRTFVVAAGQVQLEDRAVSSKNLRGTSPCGPSSPGQHTVATAAPIMGRSRGQSLGNRGGLGGCRQTLRDSPGVGLQVPREQQAPGKAGQSLLYKTESKADLRLG